MTYTEKDGIRYLVKLFSVAHRISKFRTKSIFRRCNLYSYLADRYMALSYMDCTPAIEELRSEIEKRGGILPEQKRFGADINHNLSNFVRLI